MYGRKIKVLKKKTKSSGVKSNDRGSSWGPRIALYEREREASQYQLLQKQSTKSIQASSSSSTSVSNQSSHSATYAHHLSHNPSNNRHGHGSGSNNEELEPNTRTISPETTILNGSHHRDRDRPGSIVTVNFNGSSNINSNSNNSNQSHYGSSIYHKQQPLQSQQEFSNSTRKLSGGNPNDNLSKPLTVIIPAPDRFTLSSDFGPEIDSSLPSTKTWQSSPDPQHQNRRSDVNVGLEDSSAAGKSSHSHIKPKSVTDRSSSHNNYSNGNSNNNHRIDRMSPAPDFVTAPSSSSIISSDPNRSSDEESYARHKIIKMPHSDSKTLLSVDESHTSKNIMQKGSKTDLNGNVEGLVTIQNPRVDGSAITALAQGIAMVYVPMEAYSNSNINSNSNSTPGPPRIGSKSPEQQAVDNLNDMIDGKHEVYSSSSSSSNESEKFSNSHPFSQLQQLPCRDENKDPDVDSLLESFDSIMFKPKSALKSGGSSNHSHGYVHSSKGSGHQSNRSSSSSSSTSSSSTSSSASVTIDPNPAVDKPYVVAVPLSSSSSTSSSSSSSSSAAGNLVSRPKQQISESPPPLPPPNSSHHNKAKKPDKNLRFSEHLENFEFESMSSEKVTSLSSRLSMSNSSKKYQMGGTLNTNADTVSQYSQAQSQLDTQSVTTEFIPEHHHHQHHNQHSHSHNHQPSNNSHSHLSSSERSFSNISNNNTIMSCGHMKTCSNYSTLSSITSSLTDEEQGVRDPRSAIQQLRDLSLLIGGHFSPSSNSSNNKAKKVKSKSKTKVKQTNSNSNPNVLIIGKSSGLKSKLIEKEKLRRDSEGSSDSSRENSSGTDSGQCSGSGQSPTENNSPKGGKLSNSGYPSCGFGKGDCDDCFTVFKNPLALADSHSHSSSCSTGTSRISPLLTTIGNEHHNSSGHLNRCENHNSHSHHQVPLHGHGHRHRHLIIQDQNQKSRSRLSRQSIGKSSGKYISVGSHSLTSSTSASQSQSQGQSSHSMEGGRNPLIYNSSSSLSHNSHSSHGSKKLKKTKKHKRSHESLVLEYCDCSHCDCEARRGQPKPRGQQEEQMQLPKLLHLSNHNQNSSRIMKNGVTSADINSREFTHGSNNNGNTNGQGNGNIIAKTNSSNYTKRSPGSCHNSSSSASSSHSQSVPPPPSASASANVSAVAMNNNNNNLFTIDEEEFGELGDVPTTTTKLLTDQNSNDVQKRAEEDKTFMNVTIKDFNSDEGEDHDRDHDHNHWQSKCWLATDPTMGWSDLESLYSQNMKLDKPVSMNDECWTCWRELAENRPENRADANRTVDRTKRMFIWLNRRHKEFNAPWWEAKKQASIRWLITKAFAHLPKESIGDPFKESRKGKPKYRLKDEVIKGLVSGKLYCLTLDHLYENQHFRSGGLTHWDIIKILSRRGIYVAQPSDMKLTEGTLRQKKPLRIAAHIALIEAIMGLYCKETLNRDRIVATLNSLGHSVDPEISSAEQLLISWINATILTLKSYIRSNKHLKLPCGRLNRWLNVPQVHEIRDLCDGIGICSLFALYCSNDLQLSEIAVPEPDDMLNMYETIANHSIIQRLCEELFPEMVYHLCITDFLYIHGYMKQNILSFLVDLFHHLEVNPVIRVNRLTHVPIRIEL